MYRTSDWDHVTVRCGQLESLTASTVCPFVRCPENVTSARGHGYVSFHVLCGTKHCYHYCCSSKIERLEHTRYWSWSCFISHVHQQMFGALIVSPSCLNVPRYYSASWEDFWVLGRTLNFQPIGTVQARDGPQNRCGAIAAVVHPPRGMPCSRSTVLLLLLLLLCCHEALLLKVLDKMKPNVDGVWPTSPPAHLNDANCGHRTTAGFAQAAACASFKFRAASCVRGRSSRARVYYESDGDEPQRL